MEFRIGRRVGWDGEEELLRQHLDAVLRHLRTSGSVAEVGVVADLESASLRLQLTVYAENEDLAAEVAREEAGAAIREAGAFHENLLSIRDESQLKSRLNAWAGLRTPRWQYRRLETSLIR